MSWRIPIVIKYNLISAIACGALLILLRSIFRGDSELDKGDDLFIRVIAEKTPTKIEDDKKPKPGQLGDPSKERFASPLISVALSDRESGGKRFICNAFKFSAISCWCRSILSAISKSA